MKIIEKYVLKHFLPPFLLGAALFVFILMSNYMMKVLGLVALRGLGWGLLFSMAGLILPYLLAVSLPMALLLGILLSLGRLSEDGEISALRASGFSAFSFLWPLFGVAFLLSLLLWGANHWMAPRFLQAFKNAYGRAFNTTASVKLEPRSFLTLGEWKIYVQGSGGSSEKLRGISLYRQKPSELNLRIHAPRGRAQVIEGQGLKLELYDGTFQVPNLRDPSQLTLAEFKVYRVFLPFPGPEGFYRTPRLRELDRGQLLSRLREIPPDKKAEQAPLVTELALRNAVSFSPLFFAWVACPLGLGLYRRSRLRGFVWSLALLFFYYGFLAFSWNLGEKSIAWAGFAPWLPNLACFLWGLVLVCRMRRY